MRYHTPLSAAESPRGVLGRARPNIKLNTAKQGGETKKRAPQRKFRNFFFEGSLYSVRGTTIHVNTFGKYLVNQETIETPQKKVGRPLPNAV